MSRGSVGSSCCGKLDHFDAFYYMAFLHQDILNDLLASAALAVPFIPLDSRALYLTAASRQRPLCLNSATLAGSSCLDSAV
jgi:hypothetical protein